ncbi:MAG: glycoside hydrolase family 172 protein [Pirellulales bacterium]
MSYGELVHRLYDLRGLATPPVPGETSGSVTSYDRASRYDAASGRYLDWRANGDGTGSVRRDGNSIVAAELEGPGVVWRIWSADPKEGPIRFYVDGSDEPVLDMPFKSLFDAERGPFRFNQLVRELARGWNCFVPITFNKSLRIEFGEGWGMYYQITYTKFPQDWSVPSFRGTFDETELDALARANRAWAYRDRPQLPAGVQQIERDVELAGGESVDVANLKGAGAICELRVELEEQSPEEQARTLRDVSLSMAWDGEARPSVWCPMGEFFGSAPGVHPFECLPAGVQGRELRSSWYMPFGDGARVTLANDGAATRRFRVVLQVEPLDLPADKLLRFHAKWHRDDHGPAGIDRFRDDRYPDWPVLDVTGASGRFCGMHLAVWNPLHKWDDALAAQFEQPTSELCNDDAWFQREVVGNRYWYGEGDEKFFVDGEPFPSTYGTGTEDYFGFAWGTPALFDSATQAQTVNINNTGHISLVRFQLADNVPFQDRFEACLEKYHGNNWPVLYAVTPFWYQAAGTADRYAAVPVDERIGYERPPTPRKPRVPTDGVYEGERDLVPRHAGAARPQDMAFAGPHWSGNAHLLLEGSVGDEVTLQFAVGEAFQGDLELQLTQAPDYAVSDISIDGKSVAQGVDCYAPGIQLAPPLVLKDVSLQPGVHTLSFRFAAANQEAKHFGENHHLLGVDVMRLKSGSSH